MAANADEPNQGDVPCTDRQSAGESCVAPAPEIEAADSAVDHTPETLYLVRIAMLEARVATLEADLESKERDLQHVVDRYEHVLQERDACRDEPLVSDEFASIEIESDATETTDRRDRADRDSTDGERSAGPVDRLRELLS
ncbi:hypothetical protein ACFQMA_13580 [Halosimplex aquaticum]|uniref:Uncharacterized protein n=1 Tax=Halosimplex aquaticum TaxID=3026162 RepID=A0ABD5Y0L3_9EURY|nr:hypothetical protein [Halosimplex aquaticum]